MRKCQLALICKRSLLKYIYNITKKRKEYKDRKKREESKEKKSLSRKEKNKKEMQRWHLAKNTIKMRTPYTCMVILSLHLYVNGSVKLIKKGNNKRSGISSEKDGK